MGYVYYCVFCGFHEESQIVEHAATCAACGGALSRARVDGYSG